MTSTRNANSGCFSGIVRRLLCNGSPQTHPSDHITEPTTMEFDHAKIEPKTVAKVQALASASPGVVARLMGLDSLPEPNWAPKARNADSVTRSRSVNFMEYLLELDLTQGQSQHRRVRTSASFREVPTLLNQQNHEFFAMYLDNVDKTKRLGSELRKSEMGFGELKQKRPERNKNKEKKRERVVLKKENQGNNKKISKFKDEPRRVSHKHISKVGKCSGAKVSGFVSPLKLDVNRKSGVTLKAKSPLVKPINQKEVSLEVKCSKRKSQHEIKEVEPIECSSENSSPVSVLDVNDFDIYDTTPLSVQTEDTRSMDLNFKKKSPSKTTNFDYPSPHSTGILNYDDVEFRAIKKKDYELLDTPETQYYRELVAKLLMLTEEDIKKSNWIAKDEFKFDDFEEICFDFGQQILDLMLQQVVDELMGLHMHGKFLTCDA